MSCQPDQGSLNHQTDHRSADVVVCGAGIAGISAAYHLSVRQGIKNVLIVDEGSPLSMTSDKSTECYRNFWPGPGDAMVSLMNRSIDILEELARESGNVFQLSRRGYVYATATSNRVSLFERAAEESSQSGRRTSPYPHRRAERRLPMFHRMRVGSKVSPWVST